MQLLEVFVIFNLNGILQNEMLFMLFTDVTHKPGKCVDRELILLSILNLTAFVLRETNFKIDTQVNGIADNLDASMKSF